MIYLICVGFYLCIYIVEYVIFCEYFKGLLLYFFEKYELILIFLFFFLWGGNSKF